MNDSALRAAAARAVGVPGARIDVIGREDLLYDPFLSGRAVVRLRGVASAPSGAVPWSMIEKTTEGPAVASAYLYDNGAREYHAYGSGVLDDLAPSVAAPAVYGVHEAADGGLKLWLEDLGDSRRLAPTDVLSAAHDLGQFAGRWVGRVPRHPWLFGGWLDRHSQPEVAPRDLARLRAVRSPGDVEARLGRPVDEAIAAIEDNPTFRSALADVPQTLCHHDAVASNVFRRHRDGRDETVLIDWESIGPGAIGADLASLLFSSPRRGDFSVAELPKLIPAALAAHLEGVREMGAPVDAGVLRLAIYAAIALRWSLARDVIRALDESAPVFRGSARHEPPEEALDELIALTHVLLDSAAEARRLIGRR